MAKKQLAKAALDRLKRSAKDGYPIKKLNLNLVVTSSKLFLKVKNLRLKLKHLNKQRQQKNQDLKLVSQLVLQQVLLHQKV
jgi:hypothetical protein